MGLQARHRRSVALLLVLGVLMRLGWSLWKLHAGMDMRLAAEAFNVARNVGAGHGIAGAYGDDLPTAHLLPIPPLIAGGVFALLGIDTPAAELTLSLYAIALAMGRIVLLERSFARLGVAPRARVAAVAVLSLASPYMSHEAITFRFWEGGLAGFVEAAFLFLLLRCLDLSSRSAKGWLWTAGTAALLFFINPVVGLAAFVCLAIGCWHRRAVAPVGRVVLTCTATLALLIGPWAWRNEQVFGRALPLRSNAGLELALGMDPGGLDSPDEGARFAQRMKLLHPRNSPLAYAKMRAAGGEAPYADRLGRAAMRWMVAHPTVAGRLMLHHLRIEFFPPPWLLNLTGGMLRNLTKAGLVWVASATGLMGLAARLRSSTRGWVYPAILVFIPALLMVSFEPTYRYIFLLFSPLVFAGADGVEQLWRRVSRRPAPAAPGTPVAGSRDAP